MGNICCKTNDSSGQATQKPDPKIVTIYCQYKIVGIPVITPTTHKEEAKTVENTKNIIDGKMLKSDKEIADFKAKLSDDNSDADQSNFKQVLSRQMPQLDSILAMSEEEKQPILVEMKSKLQTYLKNTTKIKTDAKPDDEEAQKGLKYALEYCKLQIDNCQIAIEILQMGTSDQMRLKVETSFKERYAESMAIISFENQRSYSELGQHCTFQQYDACKNLELEQEEPTAEEDKNQIDAPAE